MQFNRSYNLSINNKNIYLYIRVNLFIVFIHSHAVYGQELEMCIAV